MQELETGKLFHTGDIVQVGEAPEELELPMREAGFTHEVDDREEIDQPQKRPGRVRKCWGSPSRSEEESRAVDLGGAAAPRSTDPGSGTEPLGRR